MKKITLLRNAFLLVSTLMLGVFYSNAQCTYTIDGFDSFGDGWNGCSLSVTLDGTPVPGSPFTFTSGSTAQWTFTVTGTQNLVLSWTIGSFNSECSYTLTDNVGAQLLAAGPGPAAGVNYSNNVFCAGCLPPDNLSASNVLDVSADINWNDAAAVGLFNVEWGTAGFTPGTGTMITGTTNTTESLTGLTASTSYDFYVQSDCGGGQFSNWAGPFNFITACAFGTPPWLDNVEAHTPSTSWTTSFCWNVTQVSGSYDWNITGSGTTPSSNTGANTAHSGTNYFYTEASGASAGQVTTLESPVFDASGLTYPTIKFWYHMTGAQMGDLAVEAWDGVSWNQVGLISGEQQTNQSDPWLEKIIYLPSSYAISTMQFRFIATAAGSFEGDICIDDIALEEAPSCPAPSDFYLTGSDFTSGDFEWILTPISTETEWELEYGAPGFTPNIGTGSSVITSNNPETVGGLTANQFYEIYLQAICGPSDSSTLVGPILFNTFNQGLYLEHDTECGLGFVDISGTGTALGIDYSGETDLTLPWTVLFQGTPYTDIQVSSSGHVLFNSPVGYLTQTFNQTIAAAPYEGLYPFWEAIDPLGNSGGDIYYETIGTAPNRTYIVQWEMNNYINGPAGEDITFQLHIDEATGEYYFVYDDAVFGGSDSFYDYGNSATIGVKTGSQDLETSYNDPTYLQNNSCAHYYYTDCPKPTNFAVSYVTTDEAGITWSAGMASETEWTIIYGVAGFDPQQGGTTISNVTTPAWIFPGLDDITCYDVYIYADCDPGVDQSAGYMGQFCTLPNCADPTALNGATAVDSIFTDWSWTANPGYNSTGFGIQYGVAGFTPGTGTISWVDNNFTDTVADNALMGSAVYDVYVQAVCGVDSSNWVGPVQVTMPVTNDSTCFAEDLVVDGPMYTFNNAGASTDVGETTIAPPATGCQTQDGWCNSNLNFTVWYTFTAPASGNVKVDCGGNSFDGQVAVYEVIDCADFATYTLLGANDDNGGNFSPEVTVCGMTPGNTYYILFDSYSTVSTGIFNMQLFDVDPQAGTDLGLVNVCLGDTVDLFDQISGYDAGGTWLQDTPTLGLNGSMFSSGGLASQVYGFQYVVTEGCAADTVATAVEVYAPSSAGNDGVIDICQNQPFNLYQGLSGNVDMGGQWYDPANNPTSDDVAFGPAIPGSYNYDYVTGNGVCPDDSANVIVNVDPSCNYLDLQEVYFEGMEVYPNPTTNMIYISNAGSVEVYNYEVTDLNGKVITAKEGAINGTETTEVNVGELETGVYLIRVFNENAERTFRIVKQ